MAKQFITIQEASSLSGKSIQTIRRLIKSKKVKSRKVKTPQGFNYSIFKDDLFAYYKLSDEVKYQNDDLVANLEAAKAEEEASIVPVETTKEVVSSDITLVNKQLEVLGVKVDEYQALTQKLVDQNEKDKENFFRLIKTFQDRIVLLESQLKNLDENFQPKWYEFWR